MGYQSPPTQSLFVYHLVSLFLGRFFPTHVLRTSSLCVLLLVVGDGRHVSCVSRGEHSADTLPRPAARRSTPHLGMCVYVYALHGLTDAATLLWLSTHSSQSVNCVRGPDDISLLCLGVARVCVCVPPSGYSSTTQPFGFFLCLHDTHTLNVRVPNRRNGQQVARCLFPTALTSIAACEVQHIHRHTHTQHTYTLCVVLHP